MLSSPWVEPERTTARSAIEDRSVYRGLRAALPLAVVATAALALWPCLDNGFVDFDDDYLLVENPAYRDLGWGAAAAALAFGIHPLRVESVAWATERRDVLSGLLFLGTVLLYLAAQTAPGSSRRWRLAGSSALWAAGAAAVAALGWLTGLGVLTWRHTQIWRHSGTLFRAALAHDPACAVCHANLGVWLVRQGARVTGLQHILQAERLRPDLVMAHGRVGWAFAALGMDTEAIAAYRREIGRRPGNASLHLALGGLPAGRPARGGLASLRDRPGVDAGGSSAPARSDPGVSSHG
jgi:hypothetical protein